MSEALKARTKAYYLNLPDIAALETKVGVAEESLSNAGKALKIALQEAVFKDIEDTIASTGNPNREALLLSFNSWLTEDLISNPFTDEQKLTDVFKKLNTSVKKAYPGCAIVTDKEDYAWGSLYMELTKNKPLQDQLGIKQALNVFRDNPECTKQLAFGVFIGPPKRYVGYLATKPGDNYENFQLCIRTSDTRRDVLIDFGGIESALTLLYDQLI